MISSTKKRYLFLWIIIPIVGVMFFRMFSNNVILLRGLVVALLVNVLFFSVVMHELAHGIVANVCGDNTAKNSGRLTFNPISHISTIGTIIFPLVMYFLKAPMIFGWAKPIPFNPLKLKKHPRDQVALVLAGPIINFLLAYIFFLIHISVGIIYKMIYPQIDLDLSFHIIDPIIVGQGAFSGIWFVIFEICNFGILINVTIGGFNLIPFPPLDGFWILKALIPKKMVVVFSKVQNFGFILIFIAIQLKILDKLLYPVTIIMEAYQILICWLV